MGYTGGTDPHPTYASVSDGEGEVPHVESVRLRYHPAEVSYEELLDVFWTSHDPFQDVSAIWPHDEEQMTLARASAEQRRGRGQCTTIRRAGAWHPSEEYAGAPHSDL